MNILLHICCSNCALYPVKILNSEGSDIAGYWFNPNIHPSEEYNLRLKSLKDLSDQWHMDILYDKEYRPEEYFKLFDAKHPPFPERCTSCYSLRLEKTAEQAQRQGFDAFSTTLLISPYQDFEKIRATGADLAEKYNLEFYLRDFRPSFKKAMALSKELGLYRQKYCGCKYSLKEKEQKGFKVSRGQGVK